MTCKGNRTRASVGAPPGLCVSTSCWANCAAGKESPEDPSALKATGKPLFSLEFSKTGCWSKRHLCPAKGQEDGVCQSPRDDGPPPTGRSPASWWVAGLAQSVPLSSAPLAGKACLSAPAVLGNLTDPKAQQGASCGGMFFPWPSQPRQLPIFLVWRVAALAPGVESETRDYLGDLLEVFLPCSRLRGGTGGVARMRPMWADGEGWASWAPLSRLQLLGAVGRVGPDGTKGGYSRPQGEAHPTASGFSRCVLRAQPVWEGHASPQSSGQVRHCGPRGQDGSCLRGWQQRERMSEEYLGGGKLRG